MMSLIADRQIRTSGQGRVASEAYLRIDARRVLVLLLLLLTGCATRNAPESGAATGPTLQAPEVDLPSLGTRELRVVSYNIRWPNPDDGLDRWDVRRHRVAQTIERLSPDVVGIQEAYAFQAEYLMGQLPGYGIVGVGREDGAARGEMAAILYRTERLELLGQGHLWLSDTPDVAGSVGWDAALTRMATWVVVRDRRTDHAWLVVNTHFDNVGRTARAESAKLLGRFIRDKADALGPDTAAVLMGDFNSAADSPPYLALCVALDGPRLADTYRAARQRDTGPAKDEGTFNGFRNRTNGARIDWLLVSRGVTTLQAGIDRQRIDGRNPSDHDPVWAVLGRE